MKDLFILKPTRYFGLIEILNDKPMSCDVVALEEDTILLTMNKTDVLSFFSQAEINTLMEDFDFNV